MAAHRALDGLLAQHHLAGVVGALQDVGLGRRGYVDHVVPHLDAPHLMLLMPIQPWTMALTGKP
jgi:hypothetical protein